MFAAVGGRAELEVVATGQGALDPALAGRLEAVGGVRSAVPGIQEQAALLGGEGRTAVLVMGVDPARDGLVRDYEYAAGSPLEAGAGSDVPILLEAAFARSQGLSVGAPVELVTRTGTSRAVVRGLLASGGAAAFNGGAVLFMGLTDAQRLFGYGADVNTIQLVLDDGADRDAVRAAVAGTLPAGLAVQTPSSRGDLAEVYLSPTQSGLSAVSALALVAGGFIIANAFLMSVGERRRQLALLRALGATRRQVTRLLVREAMLLGVAGTVIGLAVGVAAAQVLSVAVGRLLGADLPSLQLSPRPFVVGAVLGPGLALVATYFPPAARLGWPRSRPGRRRPGGDPGRSPSAALCRCGSRRPLHARGHRADRGGRGPLVRQHHLRRLLIGCVVAIPLVVGPLSRGSAWLLVPLLRSEGRLAFRQLDRHRTRTSLTVGVLFVAITVAISMGSSLLGNVRDTVDWYHRTLVGDFFVRGVLPDTATMRAVSMQEHLGPEIAALGGVERVDPLRFVPGSPRAAR